VDVSKKVIFTTLLVLFFVTPVILLILTSVSSGWKWPEIVPHMFSVRSWTYAFSESAGTWTAIGNSLWIALAVTLINLFLAIPAATALARASFGGKWIIEGMLYAPLVGPPFISVMGLYMIFIRLGLTETRTGIILSHIAPSFPYVLRALTISYRTLGCQLEEQAKLLGAGRWARLWYIVFPHILPGIVAGASLSILVSLSQYLVSFLIGGGQVITLPILLFPFISGGDQAIGSMYSLLFAGLAASLLWLMDGLLNHYYKVKMQNLLYNIG
jgi:putative spermidine/putrescine transport system permease protein